MKLLKALGLMVVQNREYSLILLFHLSSQPLTTAILVFLWSWNNYLLPLVSINKNENYTIPILISTLGSEFVTDFAAQMTAVGFAIIPVIILFIFGSKTFIEGLATGSVKG